MTTGIVGVYRASRWAELRSVGGATGKWAELLSTLGADRWMRDVMASSNMNYAVYVHIDTLNNVDYMRWLYICGIV